MRINKLYINSRFYRLVTGVFLLSFSLSSPAPAGNWSGAGFDPALMGRVDVVAEGIVRIECTNGITARIFSPDYLREGIEITPAGPVLTLDDGERIDMISDIEDPRIFNRGDGAFHPFGTDDVIQALGEIECTGMALVIDVYLLPFPRCTILSSTTRGRDIFLSPHVRELSFEGAAFIVTHETGHCFQNRYLPPGSTDRWNEYKRLRGIDNEAVFNAYAEHAYRPAEIFAEDFRVLFGGAAARYDGRIENPDLSSPGLVAGLEEFYEALTVAVPLDRAIARVDNYPNPFNPATEVKITFTDAYEMSGERITVRIYDVAGSFVRELFSGISAGRDLRLEWDGKDSRGETVASAAYFCMVRRGAETVTRKLLLIK